MTTPETFVVRWTPPESRAAGGHTRTEEVWTGEHWRTVGSEIVANVAVSSSDAGRTYHGP